MSSIQRKRNHPAARRAGLLGVALIVAVLAGLGQCRRSGGQGGKEQGDAQQSGTPRHGTVALPLGQRHLLLLGVA